MEIRCHGGGHAVHAAVEAGHGGGEEARDDKPCDAFRQFGHDIEREDGISGGEVWVKGLGMIGEEHVEGGSHEEKEQGGGDSQYGVGPDAPGGCFLVLRGEVALDHGLVAPVADETGCQSAQHERPQGGLGKVPAEVEGAQLVGRVRLVDDALESARSLACDGSHHVDGPAEQNDNLYDVGPDNGLDAAHGDVDDAQDAHDEDAGVDVDARDHLEGERGQEQHDAYAGQLQEDEETAGHEPDGAVEASFEEFVCGGDVQLPIKGEKAKHDQGSDHYNGQVAEEIGPVGGVGLGRQGHEGYGAQLGAEYAEPRRPPGNAPACLEEIFGALFLLGQANPDDDEHREINGHHHVIEGAKAIAPDRFPQQDLGGSDTRRGFARGKHEVLLLRVAIERQIPLNGLSGDRKRVFHLAHLCPSVSHCMIPQEVMGKPCVLLVKTPMLGLQFSQFVGLRSIVVLGFFLQGLDPAVQCLDFEEALPVGPAKHEQVGHPHGSGGARHHAERLAVFSRYLPKFHPSFLGRVVFVGIGQKFGGLTGSWVASAEEEKAIVHTNALGGSHRQNAAWAGPRIQFLPCQFRIGLGEVEGPEVLRRVAVRGLFPPSQIHDVSYLGPRHFGEWSGQVGQSLNLDFPFLRQPLQAVDVRVATLAITTTDAEQAFLRGDGHSIGGGLQKIEFRRGEPCVLWFAGGVLFQDIYVIPPNFLAPEP